MRRTYLDNIRWGTVLLVLFYHVLYVFNASGVPGSIGSFTDVQYQDAPMYFVYPWFMVLLFAVAGISSRYALEKLSHKAFVSARTRKLLVPSTLGLFVLQWLVGYFNMAAAGAFEQMGDVPGPIQYMIMVLSGIGTLWFIQKLCLFSLLLVVLRKLDKNYKLYDLCGRAFGGKWGIVFFLLLALPVWGAAQIGNVPVITVYRFGIYGIAYLLGYFVLSHDKVQETLERFALPLGISAVMVGIGYVVCYFGQNFTDASILQNFFTNIYLWVAVLAILGCGKKWLS
ncbi:MAG: acyltransferase family protein, partial [Oscillospiraceae bacterium]|nr:acyltransferase family protein [Oscillospiraceae bacterium]